MSPSLNISSAQERFKHSNVIEIRNGTMHVQFLHVTVTYYYPVNVSYFPTMLCYSFQNFVFLIQICPYQLLSTMFI